MLPSIASTSRIVLAGLLISPTAAELQWGPPRAVVEIAAPERLLLAEQGEVRLAGIRVPEAGAQAARAALMDLTQGREVRLGLEPAPLDRYGHLAAQIERTDGLWLQGALLGRGLAQVHTRPDETARAAEMLALERAARARRVGLWADARFRPRPADQAYRDIGSFQIVHGRVRRAARVGSYLYLNFSDDWSTDFTLRFRRAELDPGFEAAGIRPEDLPGRRVRVRGFLLEAGGPLIEVSHPEQIEVLP